MLRYYQVGLDFQRHTPLKSNIFASKHLMSGLFIGIRVGWDLVWKAAKRVRAVLQRVFNPRTMHHRHLRVTKTPQNTITHGSREANWVLSRLFYNFSVAGDLLGFLFMISGFEKIWASRAINVTFCAIVWRHYLKLTEDCHEILRKQTSFTFSRHNLVILNLQHVIAYIYEFGVHI